MSENKIITKDKRVRKNSTDSANLKIDEKTLNNIRRYCDLSEQEITQRLKELDEEWDIERTLEINMSTLALSGIVLSMFGNRKWLALPTVVLGFFAQHALQGWCPPVPIFRFFKVRTRNEINQEKHALKALRGDYENLNAAEEAFVAARKRQK